MNREAIYQALFELGSAATWDDPARGFKTSSRRLVVWTECPDQPALYQVEHDDDYTQVTGLPYRVILRATWVVYQNVGKDPKSIPGRETNLIQDALDLCLQPRIVAGQQYVDRQTLGGLVYHCHIGGTVFKDSGDLDGQGVIVTPIQILVP